MKKIISIFTLIAGLALVAPAFSVTAYWTGKSHYVTTVTYKQAVECEYQYSNQKFWRIFGGTMCPGSIQIQ